MYRAAEAARVAAEASRDLRIEPVRAALDAMLADERAYAAFAERCGPFPGAESVSS